MTFIKKKKLRAGGHWGVILAVDKQRFFQQQMDTSHHIQKNTCVNPVKQEMGEICGGTYTIHFFALSANQLCVWRCVSGTATRASAVVLWSETKGWLHDSQKKISLFSTQGINAHLDSCIQFSLQHITYSTNTHTSKCLSVSNSIKQQIPQPEWCTILHNTQYCTANSIAQLSRSCFFFFFFTYICNRYIFHMSLCTLAHSWSYIKVKDNWVSWVKVEYTKNL